MNRLLSPQGKPTNTLFSGLALVIYLYLMLGRCSVFLWILCPDAWLKHRGIGMLQRAGFKQRIYDYVYHLKNRKNHQDKNNTQSFRLVEGMNILGDKGVSRGGIVAM
jgi:hypothetical protein